MTIPVLVLALIIGAIVGVIRGGNLRASLGTRIYHPEFLASAVLCALVVTLTNIDRHGVIAFVALATAFVFTVMNLHLVGMVILSIGLALNLFVFLLNFETPVRPHALVEAEIVTSEALEGGVRYTSGHTELADGDTLLGFLGDTFPVRWIEQVLSIGDLIFLVGLANVVGNVLLNNRRRSVPFTQLFTADEFTHTSADDPEPTKAINIDLELTETSQVSVYADPPPRFPESSSPDLQSQPDQNWTPAP